jgi:DNA-binding MarR family transcriptional regulator
LVTNRVPADRDRIDQVADQWAHERPARDISALPVLGRMYRISRHLEGRADEELAPHGINNRDLEVLSALQRSGRALSPSALAEVLMITPGGMTSLLDRLERARLVRRSRHPHDRRAVLVSLTPDAERRIDAIGETYAQLGLRLLSPLSDRERTTLENLLRKLLVSLEDPA